MIQTRQIQKTLIGALEEYCACYFVPSDTAQEMPEYPYVSFSLIRAETAKGTYHEGDTLYQPVNLTYSFTVQSDDAGEATNIAWKIKDYCEVTGQVTMKDKDITILKTGEITSRDNYITIEYEHRRGLDVVFGIFNRVERPDDGTIDTIHITKE